MRISESTKWASVIATLSTVSPSKEANQDEEESKEIVNNEKEEAFWSVARPMAILAVFGGISPYPWPRNKNDVNWKWHRRWPTIIHFFLLATYAIILIYKPPPNWVGRDTSKSTELATYVIMQTVILGAPWANYFQVLVKVSKIWKLFHRFSQLNVDRKLKKYSILLVAVCFLLTLLERLSALVDFLTEPEWYGLFYLLLFLHSLFLFNLIPVQIIFLVIVIRSQLQHFNKQMMEVCSDLCSSPKGQNDLSIRRKLTSLTDLFYELYLLVQNMDKIYGTSIMITYLNFVVWSTSYLFYFIVLSGKEELISLLLWAVIIVAVLASMMALTVILGSIPRQSTKALIHLIHVNRLVTNPVVKSDIEALIQKMTGPPIEITASSYFTINRGLLTAVVGAVTTYLIVLAQFKVAEEALDIVETSHPTTNTTDVTSEPTLAANVTMTANMTLTP